MPSQLQSYVTEEHDLNIIDFCICCPIGIPAFSISKTISGNNLHR